MVNAQLMDSAPLFLHMHKAGFLITLLMCSNEKKLNLTKYFLSFIRYGLYVHGGIDGYSRLIPYLRCSPFNTAKVAFCSFLAGVERYSIPSRVRLDAGVENGLIRNFMVHANGPDRGSALTGKSVHNQRIKRLWRDVYSKVLQVYY